MNLVHLIARQWRQRRARTALSIASVAIAAAAVLGVMLAQTSVRMAYRKLLAATEGQPTLEIVSAEGTRFDRDIVPQVTDIFGVQAATPLVTRATMARTSGKRFRTVLLGVAQLDAQAWQMLPLVEGAKCSKDGEALRLGRSGQTPEDRSRRSADRHRQPRSAQFEDRGPGR